jgi:hypothetical protein
VNSGGGAYVTPQVIVTAEPRFEWKRAGVAGAVNVIPTGKIDTRDGITLTERAEGYARLAAWRLGAGVSHSQVWTSQYGKDATRPYIVGGYRDEDMDFALRYFLPYGDKRNGLTGPEFIFDVRAKGRLWFRLRGDLYSAYTTDAPQLGRKFYGAAGGGLVWRFR